MTETSTAAADHRATAGTFTALVDSAPAGSWDQQSPVADWKARDVVGHLVEWFPGFLESGAGIVLPKGPAAADDPVAAWHHHVAAVQDLLDDPATATKVLSNPHLGDVPLDQAVDRFYTGDVFLHTWDLAKATGQELALDEGRCAAMLDGMEPMDEMLRQSGQYGPKVAVPEGASAQDRLMGFIGRDPSFSRPCAMTFQTPFHLQRRCLIEDRAGPADGVHRARPVVQPARLRQVPLVEERR